MMYPHIGAETALRSDEIVAVCDLDNATWSRHTRAMLRAAEQAGRIVNCAEDLPRSFVLCADGTVYLSQFNSATLLRRAENETFE